MMNNSDLAEQIEIYVSSRLRRDVFSSRTARVVRSVLGSLASSFHSPSDLYQALRKNNISLYTIKTYFNYASTFEREQLGTERFAIYLKTNKAAFKNCYKEKTRILRQEDFDRLMDANLCPSVKNLLALMGLAGLRISEALNAQWRDLENGFLKVIGKGNKQRLIPFNKKKLIANGLGSIVGKLDLNKLRRSMKPFTPHDFRAFYATYIANHPELNIKDAAMLLGHASITTTSRYVRSDLNRIAKVLNG
jgi:integrase